MPLHSPALLDAPALDGTPGQAFASHKARIDGIARYYAGERPLAAIGGKAEEDKTTTLIAHLQAVSNDPDFAAPGQEPSRTAALAALLRLNKGDGKVGTSHDYDMALKGLMTIAYRYADLIGEEGVNFILQVLVPAGLSGGHPSSIEVIVDVPVLIEYPETENHLLMIESTRYLVNQLLFDRTRDRVYANSVNGLSRWLLGYMQTIARHDFLEFNARPYQRLALHALYNLHEFARESTIRTAAQILLDYTMMKFALSSNRGRRVSPFRRLQHRIDHQANLRNYPYSELGDQVAGFFMAYTGYIDAQGNPGRFPASLTGNALISGPATYRPPVSAYHLAMHRDNPPSLHRFYHGTRPRLRASPEDAEGGVEIYYQSPSFLMSAGGSFLNSGYGSDGVDLFKQAWEQTSRAQASTLIPTRADTSFHDLIRFEAFPDPIVDPYADDPDDPDTLHAQSVNLGVHRGIMAGANLRPAEKKTVYENTATTAPALAAHDGRLQIAWKGSGNDNLNVARVQATKVFGIDGVEGIEGKGVLAERSEHAPALVSHHGDLFLAWTGVGNERLNVAKVVFDPFFNAVGITSKVVLNETSEAAPALASHGGRLYLAWKGSGNDNLNLSFSDDDGATFKGTRTFNERSKHGPALTSHDGRLFFAWTGIGNEHLNLARVALFGSTAGGFGIDSLENKVVLNDTSEAAPALAAHDGRLFVGWKGAGNDNLNVAFSDDDGATFKGNVTLGERSELSPAIAACDQRLYLAWTGVGNEYLNLRVSRDGAFRAPDRWLFSDLKNELGLYLAAYRTPSGNPGALGPLPDNLAIVTVMEADRGEDGLTFDEFRGRLIDFNWNLPAQLNYGEVYPFRTAEGQWFTVSFQLTGSKYRARILEHQEMLEDLATLPLVSGEYMSAPGGHNGLIEICQPGCDASVVLDFRDGTNPTRREDIEACPAPWLARVQGLFVLSGRFRALGKATYAHLTLVDAVQMYDEFVDLDPDLVGPPLVPTLLEALSHICVDFSVPEHEVRSWLGNPRFTPYPAIAQALLLLGRSLKSPVFLDVIVWNYEQASGVESPRRAADVESGALKAAILDAFNVRHGTMLTEPEDVFLVP